MTASQSRARTGFAISDFGPVVFDGGISELGRAINFVFTIDPVCQLANSQAGTDSTRIGHRGSPFPFSTLPGRNATGIGHPTRYLNPGRHRSSDILFSVHS